MKHVALIVGLAGCGQLFGLEEPQRQTRGDAMVDDAFVGSDSAVGDVGDVGIDVPQGLGPWGTAELAFPSTTDDDDPTLTANMLVMYFDRGADVWMTSRISTNDPWGTPTKVNELSTLDVETTPEVNANGLFIMVASNRPNSQAQDIWWSLRASVSDPWPSMNLLPNVNSSSGEAGGNMTADTLTLVYASNRPGGSGDYDLYYTTRPDDGLGTTFDAPTRIAALSTASTDAGPFITGDGSEIYFDSGGDLYHATRTGNGWSSPMPITELNTSGMDTDPWVSADGRHIYFARGARIYHATR